MILTHLVMYSFLNGAGGTPIGTILLSDLNNGAFQTDSTAHGALVLDNVTPSPTYGRTRGMPFPPGHMRS